MKMKHTLVVALAAAALPAMAPAAKQSSDMITLLLDKAAETYATQGYAPTGWDHRGTLAKDGTETIALTLPKGRDMQVIGLCDGDCNDLDMELMDANGAQISKDDKDDAFPIVTADNAGSYTARVKMVDCSKPTCGYALRAFVKK